MDLKTIQNICRDYTRRSSAHHNQTYTPGRTNLPLQDIPNEYQNFARLTTPDTLDLADFYSAWEKIENGQWNTLTNDDKNEAKRALRNALFFTSTPPENIQTRFKVIENQYGVVATAEIIPQNLNTNAPPIVFAGGLHLPIACYYDFLTQLALTTKRRIIAFDTPGVGGSLIENHVTQEVLDLALTSVVDSYFKDKQDLILMGHSAGTVSMRSELYNSILPDRIRVIQRIFIAPISWGFSNNNDLHFNFKYLLNCVYSIFKNHHFIATENEGSYFNFNMHDQNEQDWLNSVMQTQSFPVRLVPFVSAMFSLAKQPLWSRLNDAPSVEVVLFENDKMVRLTKAKKWAEHGALVVENADHAYLTGQNVDAEFVRQISDLIEDHQSPNQIAHDNK